MAAVYTENQTSLRINTEKVSSDSEKDSSLEIGADSASCAQELSAENSAVGWDGTGSPAPEAREHAAVAAWSAADPPIRIKEEPLEDSEYLAVHVDDVAEGNWEQAGGGGHYSGRADGDLPFCCEENNVFGNKESYLDHRREHTHDGPIVCLDTDTQWDNLLVSTDGGHQTLCCALCGCKFSNSREFFTHQLKHRNDLIKQETGEGLSKQKLFECSDCGKTYSSIGQCLNHQRSHKQASKSVFHQLAHLKKKSFQCPTCGRSYSRASALDAHRRCHEEKLFKSKNSEGEKYPAEEVTIKPEEAADTSSEHLDESPKKLFECLDCGKSFRSMGGLGTHQRFSVNCSSTTHKVRVKRSFDCTECGKTFHRPMAMACHQRWHKRREQFHSNEHPFQCKECGREFTSLTFYNKHQRLAHTNEMPAKSFLNQVVQLQKKAFECLECGRRFSRSSALHSHQLCHTDVFSDMMEGSSQKASTEQTIVSYQNNQEKSASFDESSVYSANIMQTNVVKKELKHDESFNTESSKAEHDCKPVILEVSGNHRRNYGSQQNSDLELVCESDQEEKDFNLNPCKETVISSQAAKPQVDVNIVQLDCVNFNEGLETGEMDQGPSQEPKKYECSDCNRTFDKASSLRCHMLWHRGGLGKKSRYRRNIPTAKPNRKALIKCEICGHESFTKASHSVHLGKHEDKKPYKSITYQLANLQKNSLKCDICGMHFSRLSALQSHQQRHNNVKKPYECLQCDKSYSNLSTLQKHQKACSGKKPHSDKEMKTELFNPSKTLLGPKVHHCKKCKKGFWSIGAFIHHKQYQCADINIKNSGAPITSENGCVRRKRRGRKRVMMTSHNHTPPAMPDRIKSKLYKCDVCDKSYRVIGCFLKHKLIHQSQETQPPVKSFDYQVKQLQKNMYSCPDCGKLFSRAMALQFHMRSHGYETGLPVETTNMSNQFEGPQCPNCSGVFNCEASLEIHRKHCFKAKNKNVKKCQDVKLNELGAPKEDKSVHKCEDEKDSVTSDMKYACDECDRSFSVVGALNFHKRIHRKASGSMSESVNVPPSKPEEPTAEALFCCTECGRKFSTNSALGTHRRWHKDKKLARFILKNSKMSRKNMENGPFLCNLCGKGFFYLCVLRRHQKYHPPITTLSDPKRNLKNPELLSNASSKSSLDCPDCDESFISGSLLAAHFASHHAKPCETETKHQALEPHFSVQVSDQAVLPIANLSTPVTLAGRANKPKLKNYCQQCHRKFVNTRALRAHVWQKHRKSRGRTPAKVNSGLKPLFCSRCGKRYVSHGALQNHLRLCNSNNESLKQPEHKPDMVEEPPPQHRPSESGTKCLFKCHKCGKAFSGEKHLNAHKEAARTRPYCCALCCRSYWTESQLQQHLIWHDEIRRRLPTEMRYRLNSSASVSGASNKDQVQGTNLVSPAKMSSTATTLQVDRNYKCHQCCKMFLSQHALKQHQTLHKGEEPYHCSLCPKTFAEIKDLIDHHQECLGDKELSATPSPASSQDTESLTCIECGISFSQETDLHQHYIDHARGGF